MLQDCSKVFTYIWLNLIVFIVVRQCLNCLNVSDSSNIHPLITVSIAVLHAAGL